MSGAVLTADGRSVVEILPGIRDALYSGDAGLAGEFMGGLADPAEPRGRGRLSAYKRVLAPVADPESHRIAPDAFVMGQIFRRGIAQQRDEARVGKGLSWAIVSNDHVALQGYQLQVSAALERLRDFDDGRSYGFLEGCADLIAMALADELPTFHPDEEEGWILTELLDGELMVFALLREAREEFEDVSLEWLQEWLDKLERLWLLDIHETSSDALRWVCTLTPRGRLALERSLEGAAMGTAVRAA